LNGVVSSNETDLDQQLIVRLKLLDQSLTRVWNPLAESYCSVWSEELGLEVERRPDLETGDTERVHAVQGLLARMLVASELGYHVLRTVPQSPPRLLCVEIDGITTPNHVARESLIGSDEKITRFPFSDTMKDAAFRSFDLPKEFRSAAATRGNQH
jgi:hypothetical protein